MRPTNVTATDRLLQWQQGSQWIRVEAWVDGAVRVRASVAPPRTSNAPSALISNSARGTATTQIGTACATLVTGGVRCSVDLASGRISFHREHDDYLLLQEVFGNVDYPFLWPLARDFTPVAGDLFRISARFEPQDQEQFFGLGQHRHGLWDQKGAVIELFQRNGEVCIPLAISSRGYGFMWHQPGVGRVELAANVTHWVASGAYELDYFVLLGSPKDVLRKYAELTGLPSSFPRWASGFWQSKLRYRSQDELLEVARRYHEQGYPLAVIVADFMHWEHQGDFDWDPKLWPNPRAMCDELRRRGVELMASIWPTAQPKSRNWNRLNSEGLLVQTNRGSPLIHHFTDAHEFPNRVDIAYLDSTNPATKSFLWEQVHKNYVSAGCRALWLDTCEPEVTTYDHDNLRFFAGSGTAVSCIYPLEHQKALFEGLRSTGENSPLILSRSAWLGSQRYGAAVWSGDVPSTWEMLARSIRTALNVAMSGLPWWTTDIGGFSGGNPSDPAFQQLLVRWFQFGTFCPITRLHGQREPVNLSALTGAPNEIWSFGREAELILVRHLKLREKLRAYIHASMEITSQTGVPMLRPMALEFPEQSEAWRIDNQFLFGESLLIAPIYQPYALSRQVWLPAGHVWENAWTAEPITGGRWVSVPAPLDQIPVFIRDRDPSLGALFSETTMS